MGEKPEIVSGAYLSLLRILAEAIASLPLHVYQYRPNHPNDFAFAGDPNLGGKERNHEHALYYLLHDEANPEVTSFLFRETLMSHLLLWGNAFAQIVRDGGGRVLGLYPLLPSRMTVDRDAAGALVYTYQADDRTVTLRRDDVLHIPGLGFDGVLESPGGI